MRIPGAFDSGTNVNRSTLMDCESSINLRVESGQVGTPKVEKYSQRTPGTRFLFSVGSSPVQCLFKINDRAFGVSGTTFFEVFADDTYVVRGTVAASGSTNFPLATMCSNGTAGDQVAVCSGGYVYIFTLSTNAFALVVDMDLNQGSILMIEFFAGYFFALWFDSRTVQWSALEDGTDWDALDVMERSWASDNIMFIVRNGTNLLIAGNQTSEYWYLTGGVEVIAPAQGSLIEHGAVSSFGFARVEKDGTTSVIWLDQSERGGGMVISSTGLQYQVLSTYAVAFYEQSRGHNLEQARCFAMQIDGHVDVVMNNDETEYDLTPVYDVSENQWHDRALWDPAADAIRWRPYRYQCQMYFDQRHFVGDRLTGAVYEMSMAYNTEQLADV